MRTLIPIVLTCMFCWGCSDYRSGTECKPEVCDGKDTDCDGFVDETRHKCPDGTLVTWCQCDENESFECLEDPGQQCRDTSCDDGTDPQCYMEPPVCEEGEILAHIDYCFLCVDPETCLPPADCQPGEVKNYGCPDGSQVTWCSCNRSGIWDCIENPGELCRDTSCDDGSEPMCGMLPPECREWEILAYQDFCYLCVNPETCRPWGEAECGSDRDCRASDYCDSCGSSSCPTCEDCVPACLPHGCETEDMALCNMARPECRRGQVAVVREGCWVCVSLDTCQEARCQAGEELTYTCPDGQEVFWCRCGPDGDWECIDSPESQCRDTHCDDGTEIQCDGPEPVCEEWEILAWQNHCYECVNPVSCKPWGVPGCEDDFGCPPDQYCDGCATSSCPMCDDCLAACMPHGCDTELDLMCWCARPDCGPEAVAIIFEGCWICVYFETCEFTGEECP